MIVLLDADQVAERIGVARRTAMAMMLDMHPVTISGKTRKRIRVSEENLERWMIAHSDGKSSVKSIYTGSKRRLERR
jgi:Tfp pilus assembly protein FimT